jgi:hypothetical protein
MNYSSTQKLDSRPVDPAPGCGALFFFVKGTAIGQLARGAWVNVSTVHYLKGVGFLQSRAEATPAIGNTARKPLASIAFIWHAQGLGFSSF